MASDKQHLVGCVAGSHLTIRVTITGIDQSDPLTRAWFTVKTDKADADPGLFQVEITTTLTGSGQITDDGSATGTATCIFEVLKTQTALCQDEVKRWYDIKYVTASEQPDTPIWGQFVMVAAATLSST